MQLNCRPFRRFREGERFVIIGEKFPRAEMLLFRKTGKGNARRIPDDDAKDEPIESTERVIKIV